LSSAIVTTDQNPTTKGRTRPVCEWPSWPKYTGTEPNRAASFTCARSAEGAEDEADND
jgi:feruloyl esterase